MDLIRTPPPLAENKVQKKFFTTPFGTLSKIRDQITVALYHCNTIELYYSVYVSLTLVLNWNITVAKNTVQYRTVLYCIVQYYTVQFTQ